MNEAVVERYLLDQCRLRGFLCLKFISSGRNGVPDRAIVTPAATVFVEVKRPGERPRRNQLEMHAKIRRFGGQAHVVSNHQEVDHLMQVLSRPATSLPSAS